MSGVKVVARIVALAAGTVAVGVTGNQVLNDGKLSFTWAYVSWAVAVLAALYAEVFSPDPSVGALGGGTAVRGRRRVYLRQLRASVRTMETVGIATQSGLVLPLHQVYVDVSLAPQPPHHTETEPYVGRANIPPGERRTLSSFIDGDGAGRAFAVIGGPGSGKTTLMRSTALRSCRRRLRRRPLPILVYLRDHATAILAADPPGLAAVAADAGWVAGATPASWIERRLDRGGCLVMLDGLDEVADETDRGKVVAWVRRQIERHPRNTYLVTSRPHGYLSNPLPNAEVLQVRRFTGEQISQFLHNWYYAIECRAQGTAGKQVRAQATSKSDDLLGRLRTRPGLYDLAANPLLLTMIANVHRYRDALPGSRAALYAEMCDVLVHRRQESKGLVDQTGLRGPQKAHIVRGLALAMMHAKIRDIPAADACRTIAADVRDASPQMAPEDFLDEVRKSGLLVEREHGRYAFAHLTLQEYLAAAHLGQHDADLLAGNVDDPWWRETTLLWAADADATAIITACLASGTVRALALAFDCVDEARAVNPQARRQLDRLLDPMAAIADDEHRRLITTVKAARSLREVIWLSDDIVICARPVTNGLYRLFTLEEQAAGRHIPVPDDDENDPAVGMWAGDAARFVTWLNGLFDDGTCYRLPTVEELTDPAFGLVSDLSRRTVWVGTGSRPTLHQPDGVPWPYTPDPGWLRRTLASDIALTLPYLRLAVRNDHYHVLAHSRVLATALTLAPALDRRPELSILGLVLNLALASALTRIRRYVGDPAPALDLAFELALDRALDTVHTVDLDIHADDVDLAVDAALDFPLRHSYDFDRGLPPSVAVDLHLDLDRRNDRTRALALAFARDLDRGLERSLDGDVDLSKILVNIPLRSAVERAVDFALYRAVVLTRDLALDPDHALVRALDLARDRDRDRDPDRVRGLDISPLLDRDRALDRDLARGLMARAPWSQTVTVAFGHLLNLWAPRPRRNKRVEFGGALADFTAYLTGILSEASRAAGPATADPEVTLRHARDLLGAPQAHPISDVARELRDRARLLTAEAHALVTPILDRTAPDDGRALATARLGSLAAMALLRRADSDGIAQDLLLQALRSLIAIHQRADGHLVPNEVLLLVRT